MCPRRENLGIAIICALAVEFDAVSLAFDEFWDESCQELEKLAGDPNHYTVGRIGQHSVLLVLLSHTGKASAASSVANIIRSYGSIHLALLVGVCGGVPMGGKKESKEILLGDVVISNSVLQYDFGKYYPDGFHRKDTINRTSRKPNNGLHNFLVSLTTEMGTKRLQRRTHDFLKELQCKALQKNCYNKFDYPGISEDRLFAANYRHKHSISSNCICREWSVLSDPVCTDALHSSCEELGCDSSQLIGRERLQQRDLQGTPAPALHFGSIASGDMVMKSGVERDNIARKEGVIAYDMESAGIWEEVPSFVIKGVCDYADSHKNKKWQAFAAACAASAVKAILERNPPAKSASSAAGAPERLSIVQAGSKYTSELVGSDIKQGNSLEIRSEKAYVVNQGGSDFGGHVEADSSIMQGNTMII